MCTLVCSFPATLSHLGHPSGGGSAQVPSAEWWHCCWPQPPPTLGDTQSGPCSSMHLLGGHQCLSMAPSPSRGPPSPPAPLPLPGREGWVLGWQPAPTHYPPAAARARCPGVLSLLPPTRGCLGTGLPWGLSTSRPG